MNAIASNLSRAALRINFAPTVAAKAEPIRIIAMRLPWPDLKTQPNRASLRLRWRCFTEEGTLLVSETDHPLADGAASLLLNGLALPDAQITMRHHGKTYDSFGPMKLEAAAALGIKRHLSRLRLQQLAARKQAAKPTEQEGEEKSPRLVRRRRAAQTQATLNA